MSCVIDNPMCDGTMCSNCKMVAAEGASAPGDIPAQVEPRGSMSGQYSCGSEDLSIQVGATGQWQPTGHRHEGWVIYVNPRTKEVAVEVDGERLVGLEGWDARMICNGVLPERAREIAAECPLRWQDVRRILEEQEDLGYTSWFLCGPADEVADFAWSCWLDAHTKGGG